jgi:hypothetical protein
VPDRLASPDLERDSEARNGWSLRRRGTNARVLENWKAEARWAGELVIPLDEVPLRKD